MAELGQKTTLLSEIAPAITNGTALFELSGGGISPSPGSVSLVFPQPMSRDYPLVTLVSMIAPSPDWFVGRTIYLSKLPGLDKKVRVAFDWTLDLLFRKDVCAVHDLPSRGDFHRRAQRQATAGDNGQYQRAAGIEVTLEGVNP